MPLDLPVHVCLYNRTAEPDGGLNVAELPLLPLYSSEREPTLPLRRLPGASQGQHQIQVARLAQQDPERGPTPQAVSRLSNRNGTILVAKQRPTPPLSLSLPQNTPVLCHVPSEVRLPKAT